MDCADDQARVILRYVRQAMNGDGAVGIIETVIGAPNQGEPAAFSDLNLLVATGGRVRGRDDWRVLLTDTGFDLVGVNLPQRGSAPSKDVQRPASSCRTALRSLSGKHPERPRPNAHPASPEQNHRNTVRS